MSRNSPISKIYQFVAVRVVVESRGGGGGGGLLQKFHDGVVRAEP